MYLDSSPFPARRSAESPRRRGACHKPTRQTEIPARSAAAGRPQPDATEARRTRLADAIVSQWLLEQLPSDHRHPLRSAPNLVA